MRVIGYLNAAVAWRESVEEYSPPNGVVFADLINTVREAFHFQQSPSFDISASTGQTHQYVGGHFQSSSGIIPVAQLLMEPDGDVAFAANTDQCEAILAHLAEVLADTLDYRLAASVKRVSYLSNIVVEFDEGLEIHIENLGRMAGAVDRAMQPIERGMGLKRLAFGRPTLVPATTTIAALEAGDFTIERRVGHAFKENRYYCQAPLRTADHVRVLQELEDIARNA
jgi:hypothetical protein